LATDRLIAVSQEIAKQGWGWTETRTKRDYSEMLSLGRLESASRDGWQPQLIEHQPQAGGIVSSSDVHTGTSSSSSVS
jgi:hypothetical protein